MKVSKLIHAIAMLLLIVGGLNWGLVGVFNYNLVTQLTGPATQITQIIYGAVGVAAIIEAVMCITRQ